MGIYTISYLNFPLDNSEMTKKNVMTELYVY